MSKRGSLSGKGARLLALDDEGKLPQKEMIKKRKSYSEALDEDESSFSSKKAGLAALGVGAAASAAVVAYRRRHGKKSRQTQSHLPKLETEAEMPDQDLAMLAETGSRLGLNQGQWGEGYTFKSIRPRNQALNSAIGLASDTRDSLSDSFGEMLREIKLKYGDKRRHNG